ncbi:MAG: hypothetical protein VXV82_03970, partial [Bacteroidota bacterium]|nr:hypothetical protein [Bacteroidota bacterium]
GQNVLFNSAQASLNNTEHKLRLGIVGENNDNFSLRHYIQYGIKVNEVWSAGINLEQDYSEAFVFSKKQLGWDYTSMYWSFRQPNFAITLGDYRVTWGLGSVLSRHFQLQSLFIPSTWAGIQMHGKPHTSLNEVNRMRGICLDIYQKKLHGNVVFDYQHVDGEKRDSSLWIDPSSQGLHQSELQQFRRKALSLTAIGFDVNTELKQFQPGLSVLYKRAFQSDIHHSQFNLGLCNSWYLPNGIIQGELSTQIEPSHTKSITLLASMILALSPKTDYTASLQLRSLGNNEPRISSMKVIDIAEGYQVRMGLGHRWRKHYIHGAISLYSTGYKDLNNKNLSQVTLGGRYEYKRNRQENMYVLARYRRYLDIETTLHHILIRCKWTKRYQDHFSFHCYLSTQAQKKYNQWSWGQLWYTEVRYNPWKIIQHRARLSFSTHTGPDALLDYPYTISLPYGFPQAFSLGQVHLVNSLTIRWRRGIRIAILHNAKLNKENSLQRVHLQIELSLR